MDEKKQYLAVIPKEIFSYHLTAVRSMRHLFTTSNLAIYTDGPISYSLLFLGSELKELEEKKIPRTTKKIGVIFSDF